MSDFYESDDDRIDTCENCGATATGILFYPCKQCGYRGDAVEEWLSGREMSEADL